ncbi:pseudouridine synthase [Comamonas testosteroni]|uniref:pseudouridine synthase n=1 Tax=Comamonas testosteroni TaxID=285 RepID=UPI002DB58338|nr:pseudouridine synthase [Comamonas testosteroni]MEB5963324.1 pseudouridine synthase [Comamonas testosteroni]
MSVKPPKESGTPGAGNSSAPSDASSARPVLRAPAKPAKAEKPAAARGARPAGGSDRGPRGEGLRGERGARPQRERDERPRASGLGRPDGGRPVRDDGERRGGFSQRDERRPRTDRDDRFAEGGERRFGGGDRGFRSYGDSRDGDRAGERREFRPRDDRPQGGRDFGDRPRSSGFGRPDQGRFERSEGAERREFRPREDRRDERPQGGRDFGDRPRSSGFGRPDQGRFERSEGGERREFRPRDGERRGGDRFEGRRDERPQGRDFGDRPQNRGLGRPDRSEGGERREYPSRGGDRPQGRDFGDRPQSRGYGGRPEGRSLDRGDRRGSERRNDERRGEHRDSRRDERGGEPEKRHIPGSFVSEATRRPTTGIRTYRPAADGSDRAIPVKRAPEVEARQDDRPGALRINKRIADMGLCSRREADEWVENGWVTVNGEVATMGQNVVPGDRIEIDRKAQERQDQQVTILLNKPMGYVSGQAEDGHEPAVVLITNENRWNEDRSKTRFNFSQLKGLAPCGRLDIDSVGLLVLTQDGRVARQIIGEDSEVDKEYLVRVTFGDRDVDVQSVFPEEKLALLRHGLSLDEQPLKPAQVDWQNPEQLRFVLTEGKKRQIRRMCELVGLKVVGLKRIRIGGVTLGNLPTGQWRYLAAHESF